MACLVAPCFRDFCNAHLQFVQNTHVNLLKPVDLSIPAAQLNGRKHVFPPLSVCSSSFPVVNSATGSISFIGVAHLLRQGR